MSLNIRKINSFILPFILVALLGFAILWFISERISSSNRMKIEFNNFQNSLIESGYDISYSELIFSEWSFFNRIKLKDLKINNLDEENYIEWNVEEVKLRPFFFDSNRIKVVLSKEQTLKLGTEEYALKLPFLKMSWGFRDDVGISNVDIEGYDIDVNDIIKIGELKLASQRIAPRQISDLTPWFESHLEIKNITFLGDDDWSVSKSIERIYLHSNIVGALKAEGSYRDSIMSWLTRGGVLDIRKLIVKWDNLIMVGKGDIYFNEALEPNIHLNTSSKGLLKFIDKVQEQEGILDNKGVFVTKILLNNKAFKLNEDDKFMTLTTPVNINKKELSIENIPVIKF